MKVKIQFKKLHDDTQLPKQSHPGDAGMDLYAHEDVVLSGLGHGNNRAIVSCGFAMSMPHGWEAQVRPRSGMAAKKGVTVINSPGTIDAGYRGNIMVPLVNLSYEKVEIKKGDRIAQLVIAQVPEVVVELVDELSDTERSDGGFGSTGD